MDNIIAKLANEEENFADEDSKKETQTEAIVNFIKKKEIEFFHDQFNKPYASLQDNGRKVMKLYSTGFKRWLSLVIWKEMEIAPNSSILSTVTNILAGEACNDGKLHELHVRVAENEQGIWYDIGDGNAIKINKDGWELVKNPPIMFYRFNHQKVQVIPQRGGNIKDILGMLTLKNKDEQLLFLVALVACFIPNMPHPILVSHGPQGSAKSMLHRILKSMIDPSATNLLSPPGEMREFIQMASHHWVICLDNLSYLPDWLSDALCKVCTGSGFSKRELYTDDDDIIYNFKHIIGLNGISLVATKPDLLDRSILLAHETLTGKEKIKEKTLGDKFIQLKPLILGAIFDLVAKALAIKPTIKLDEFPRMADFADWGCAISLSMGHKQEDFLQAYRNNIEQQHNEALEASLVGIVVLELMKDREVYEETATKMLKDLNSMGRELELDRRVRAWPRNPNMVWKEIMKVETNLRAKGITAQRTKSGIRKIILTRIS